MDLCPTPQVDYHCGWMVILKRTRSILLNESQDYRSPALDELTGEYVSYAKDRTPLRRYGLYGTVPEDKKDTHCRLEPTWHYRGEHIFSSQRTGETKQAGYTLFLVKIGSNDSHGREYACIIRVHYRKIGIDENAGRWGFWGLSRVRAWLGLPMEFRWSEWAHPSI